MPHVSEKIDKFLKESTLSAAEQAALRIDIGAIGTTDACIVVQRGATDADSGTALLAAYAAACALTPGGNAISASNRAIVLLPPGGYKLTEALVMDTDYVDIAALVPAEPAHRLPTDEDVDPTSSAADLSSFRPQPTMVYTEVEKICVINQTAADVRLSYFTIAQLSPNTNFVAWDTPYGALWIGDVDNTPSVYFGLYCWCNQAYPQIAGAVAAWESFSGTWVKCIANSASFRLGIGDQITPTAVFSARMFDCEAGPFSFVGDYYSGRAANYSVSGCWLERCVSIGIWAENDDSTCSFSGCSLIAVQIDNTSWFIDCRSGNKSFGIGVTNAGNFIRCRGGTYCFGGNVAATPGIFSGYAEDCIAGADSFGGTTYANDGDPTVCYCSGTLLRCTATGNTRPLGLTGAILRDCRITTTSHDQHCVALLDNGSKITNCDLIVDGTGTGVPIYAATAKNVVACHCRMNNADNDADGLGSNVTNLVATPMNVIDDDLT